MQVSLVGDQADIQFNRFHRPEEVEKAKAILSRYSKLIGVQLREGGVSVQKLITTGKVRP